MEIFLLDGEKMTSNCIDVTTEAIGKAVLEEALVFYFEVMLTFLVCVAVGVAVSFIYKRVKK
jgi:hypothetical protein